MFWGSFRRDRPFSEDYGYDRGTPIDRYYIEKFLAQNGELIRGRVLEVKDRQYTERFGGDRVTRSDVLDLDRTNRTATIHADLNDAGCLDGRTFDCIILTQTLQLVFDLRAALAALSGSLAPGGTLLVTIPGITRIAYEAMGETWLWSFTLPVARRLFGEAFDGCEIDVRAEGNLKSCTGFLYGLSAEELRPAELERTDLDYQLIIAVRVRRPPA